MGGALSGLLCQTCSWPPNPCPCAPAYPRACICAAAFKRRYHRPRLRRLARCLPSRLRVVMHPVRMTRSGVLPDPVERPSPSPVRVARDAACARGGPYGFRTNCRVSGTLACGVDFARQCGDAALRTALDPRSCSAFAGGAVDRTLRVAWTLTDLTVRHHPDATSVSP